MEWELKSNDFVQQSRAGGVLANRAIRYRLRRDIFDQLQSEVFLHWGKEPAEIRRFRKLYGVDTSRPWKASNQDQLLKAFEQHQITLIGDFHALRQSQRSQKRLLDLFLGTSGREATFSLGVECLPSSAQKWIDAYLEGKLSEQDFLKKSRWKKVWGFPWENYQILFDWARDHGVPVVALNSASPTLRARDRAASKILEIWRKREPERKWVIVFGDLHLQRNSLPLLLEKQFEAPVLRIFQNVEEVAFRLMKKGLDAAVDVVRYDRHDFAVLSVPPWVKWGNYLLWFNQASDGGLEEGRDFTDSVARMVEWISRDLEVKVNIGEMTVYSSDDPELWERIEQDTTKTERTWIQMMISDGRSFYFSRQDWGYLARGSVNHAASLAMQFIHDQQSGGSSLKFHFPEDFRRMIWIETMAYFGSKLVNPKRKSNTIADLRASLSSRKINDRGTEALKLALSQNLCLFRPKHKSSWIAAAHLLGAMAGERLAHAYHKEKISRETLRRFLEKPIGNEGFDLIYEEVLEMIKSLPSPFRSKKERL